MFVLPYNYILVGCLFPYAYFNHHQLLNRKLFEAPISYIFSDLHLSLRLSLFCYPCFYMC
jgi:hypothetical protein